MKKVLLILGGCLLISIIAIIIIALLVFGYFSLNPSKISLTNFTDIFNLYRPKDLGIKYTEADLTAARKTVPIEFQTIPPSDDSKSIEFSGQKDISGTLTSEMITAMIDNAKYKYYPLSNTQVKINPDGTIETTGNIDISKTIRWAADLNTDAEITGQLQSLANTISANPSFYLKGTMSVANNKFDLNIQEAKVSVFSANQEIIQQYEQPLTQFIEERVANVPNMNIKSADFSTGKLILDATYPAIEKTMK